MKKLMTMALCTVVALSAGAQKATVDQAKKLAGKTEKIAEARELIQQAINNPETANLADTYYVAGKIEWDAFNKNNAAMMINPEKVNPVEMANELLNGYNYFVQVFPLDQVPDEKGKTNKYTKELQKKIAEKTDDFWNAGATFFGEKMYYPQAYNAFMIFGDMPDQTFLGASAPVRPDTLRAVSYFNAGISAWSDSKLDEAALAFRKARENNYTDPQGYVYEIATWQNIEQNDESRVNEARDAIFNAAKAGFDKFGMAQPLFLNNMVNSMINSGQENQAIEIVNKAINDNPDHASLYGLRAFVYDRMENHEASEADYRKAITMADLDFETLQNAALHIFRAGQQKWNEIELGDPESKSKKDAIRTQYFQVAKDLVEKGKGMTDNPSDLQYLEESIDYQLSL